jgi:hypothetical protein
MDETPGKRQYEDPTLEDIRMFLSGALSLERGDALGEDDPESPFNMMLEAQQQGSQNVTAKLLGGEAPMPPNSFAQALRLEEGEEFLRQAVARTLQNAGVEPEEFAETARRLMDEQRKNEHGKN